MKKRLYWLFNALTAIGVVSFILGFFNVGREFFDKHLSWFLASLWIGLIGSSILRRFEKRTK